MLSAVSPTVAHTYTDPDNSGSAEEHCTLQRLVFLVPLAPNARGEPHLEAGARHERTLEGVGSTAMLGLEDAGHCLGLGLRPYLLR